MNHKGKGWKRLKQITNDELEKFRPNFSRCTNHDIPPPPVTDQIILTFTYSGSGGGRLDSQTLGSGSSSSQDAQLWHWRDEFKSHISNISVALSERIKQTYEKALDQEMQLYKSSKRIPTIKLKGLKIYCLF